MTLSNRLMTLGSILMIGVSMSLLSKTLSKPLEVGTVAPEFSLFDQDNTLRSLSDFKGSYVVLYFYPKDETPGCTQEACHLRNNFEEFEDKGIKIIGINYDSPKSHKAFQNKHHLQFILLTDADKNVAKKYGTKRSLLPIPYRMTFVIDPQGIICAVLPDVSVSTHADDVLKIIKQQKSKR